MRPGPGTPPTHINDVPVDQPKELLHDFPHGPSTLLFKEILSTVNFLTVYPRFQSLDQLIENVRIHGAQDNEEPSRDGRPNDIADRGKLVK